ncbi:MAG: hypothetical protein OXP09_11390 [Gammaproteobacteria bacterium]|nr:hypothetical protein [Gammaproteobacteria bacterium]MDE0366163.1 hypothetical protein [Gammaproteobacteria bacterium]
MRSLKSSLLLSAWVSFLAVQLGGLHMHVDADGSIGKPRSLHFHVEGLHSHADGVHLHRSNAAGHEHSGTHEHAGDEAHAGDSDLTTAEASTGKWKFADFLLVPHDVGTIGRVPAAQVRTPRTETPPPIRKSRWRPPLRAPPALPV